MLKSELCHIMNTNIVVTNYLDIYEINTQNPLTNQQTKPPFSHNTKLT